MVGSGACGLIEALANASIINTQSANFRPQDMLTRSEMITLLA